MVDLSQDQPLKQKPTSDVSVGDQPPVAQPAAPPEKPDEASPLPIKDEEKIATPEQEEIKKELSELGIPLRGGSKKTRVVLATLGVILLIATLPAAVYLVKQRQEIRKEAGACPPESCTGSGYLCAGECACNWELNKGVRWHYKCVNGQVESYNILDASCNSACPGEPSPQPSPEGQKCPPGNDGQPGETCSNLNKCDIAGGCNPACCATKSDCPSEQYCSIPNGYCRAGKSCAGTTGYHKECRDQLCVNVPGGGADQCTSHDQCKETPSPTPPSCQPVKEYSGAVTPGYDCTKGGSASVTVTACLPEGCPLNGATVSYSKTIARCPGESWTDCEGACGAGATTTSLTIPTGQRCASATISCNPPNNCGSCQVDIDGYGVRRWEDSGCAAPPEYTAQCEFCRVYDTDWNLITDLSTLTVNQTIYFATRGSTTHPQGITEARIRINSGAWQETTSKHVDEFYISYTIPSADSYTIESMVYNPALGWY